jgi:hypothetical protein
MLDVMTTPFVVVGKGHEDRRRMSERVYILPDGTVLREATIVVNPKAAQSLILGKHKHPEKSREYPNGCRERFDIVAGRVIVYVVPNGGVEEDGTTYVLEPGGELTVEGGDAHIFECEPGAVLNVTTDWEFVDGKSIIPHDFDITRVPGYVEAHAVPVA